MTQITIAYRLSETGRKAAMLAGAKGVEQQLISGDATLTPERLARLSIGPSGLATPLLPSASYGLLDTYHADPESLLVAIEALWAAHAVREAERVAREAAAATREAERYLADASATHRWRPSLPAGHPLTEAVAAKCAQLVEAEAATRAREAEAEAARLAKAEAARLATLDQLAAHIREHGSEDQRGRLAEPGPAGGLGALPEAEALDSLKAHVLAPLAGEADYLLLQADDLPHEDDCVADEASYGSERVDSYPADVWRRVRALRALVPDADVDVRLHTGECGCDATAKRYGIAVEITVGALSFCRELGV